MSDGIRLTNLFKKYKVDVETVAKNAKLVPRGIYRYQTLATIKRKTIERLLKAAGIPLEEWGDFTEAETDTNVLSEQKQDYHTKGTYHQGTNFHKVVQAKGVNTTALANQMDISRRTLYRYFGEKELPIGVLLQVSEILGVDVSQLKGFGTGKIGFEKTIYQLLEQMAVSLTRIEKHLQLSN